MISLARFPDCDTHTHPSPYIQAFKFPAPTPRHPFTRNKFILTRSIVAITPTNTGFQGKVMTISCEKRPMNSSCTPRIDSVSLHMERILLSTSRMVITMTIHFPQLLSLQQTRFLVHRQCPLMDILRNQAMSSSLNSIHTMALSLKIFH